MASKTLRTVCAILLFTTLALCKDNLRVAYEWKEMDYKYENAEARWTAIENHEFRPDNVIPFGLEVYRSRMYVALPRWRDGVPASLAYFDLDDKSTKSPSLTPFPNWEAHSLSEPDPELVSPFRIRADRCGRLWVLDSRIAGVLENTTIFGPAQLLVYDLHNDNLLRRYRFPSSHIKQGSFYANLAVEDADCENTFAYAADLGAPGLVVYSWAVDNSWRVQHNFFHPEPLAGNYSIGGIEFQWDDGLYGLALSKAQPDGFATLYFHPLSSTTEFAVNTRMLRNKTLATSSGIYHDFKILGARGINGQAGAAFVDPRTEVLFYALPNLNALDCWSTNNAEYSASTQGRVYSSALDLVFPSEVKVDAEDRLWVLSNNLQEFIYDELYPGRVNYRILTANVVDAIEDTACDTKQKPLPEIMKNELDTILDTVVNRTEQVTAAGVATRSLSGIAFVGAVLLGLGSYLI
ncbi:PREDICTED: protein yellow [Rhagoletis zephyria]|uniref:protein yellow n=1 Tax=Rhagoletis zephyria TaxID=28612 RepID=UPI0008114AD1|nr:PREDICTED: protein yellow [Rhagoletis zephyria]